MSEPTDVADATDPRVGSGPAGLIRREEELRVGTERVVSGRVTVRKRVVEEEQTITVTVRREEFDVIEEGPEAAPSPASIESGVDGDEVRQLILYTERPVVTFERVPVERITLRKVATTEQQQVTEEVRREVVTVEGDPIDDDAPVPADDRTASHR